MRDFAIPRKSWGVECGGCFSHTVEFCIVIFVGKSGSLHFEEIRDRRASATNVTK